MRRAALTYILAATFAAACNRPDTLPETPRVEVSSTHLVITAPGGGYDPAPATFTVSSIGGPLELAGVETTYANGSGWLSLAVLDPASSPAAVTVTTHAEGLASGTYVATVYVTAVGAVNSPLPVKVSLVVPPPRMVLSADDVTFDLPGDALPPVKEVVVANAGGGSLRQATASVKYSEGSDWLATTVTARGDHFAVLLSPVLQKFTATGLHHATVTLDAPGAAPRAIAVAADVRHTIVLDSARNVFELLPGGPAPAPRTLGLTLITLPEVSVPPPTVNVGATWSLSEGMDPLACDGWLEATASGDSAPYELTLEPVPTVVEALPIGSCAALVNIISGGAGHQIVVIVAVRASLEPPLVQPPSDPRLVFLALTDGADPLPQTFTVTDAYVSAIPAPLPTVVCLDGSGWLTATVTGSAPPYTVSVQPHVAGLAQGTYEGWVGLGGTYVVPLTLYVADWREHGSFAEPLRRPTATALPDGTLLVTGTKDSDGGGTTAATGFEVYDPSGPSNQPHATRALGSLGFPRLGHTATALADGRVVAAGGVVPSLSRAAADTWEIFDPATGTWRITRALATPRFGHTATLLPDGRVLLAGGATGTETAPVVLAGAEILETAVPRSSATSAMTRPRRDASAVLLDDGRVLVAGGRGADGHVLDAAEVFDPVLGAWSATGPMAAARAEAALVLLEDGRVLVAGGTDGARSLASAEIYDPAAGVWSPTSAMATARVAPGLRLPSGKVLLVAGTTDDLTTSTATLERYDPATGLWSSAGTLPGYPLSAPAVTLLPNGLVAIAGGTIVLPDWSQGAIVSDVTLGSGEAP